MGITMKKNSCFRMTSLIVVLLFVLIACESHEERAKRMVDTFIEAVRLNKIDELQEARADVLAEGEYAILPLLEAVVESDGKTRSEISYMIEKIGPQGLIKNLSVVKTMHPDSQKTMLQLIASMNVVEAVPALERYIDQVDQQPAQLAVARCLADLGSQKGFDKLAKLSQSPDREKRYAVALYYNESPDSKASPDIIGRLPLEKDFQIKLLHIETLAKLGDSQAIAVLRKYGLGDKTSAAIRENAAKAIARISGEKCEYLDEKGRKINAMP